MMQLKIDTEKMILENIRRCSKVVGKVFRVIFWHENLSDKDCKKFIERNEHLLFEVNTTITRQFKPVWFLINSKNEKCSWRYMHNGSIIEGIVEYLKLATYLIKRNEDNN